MSRPRLWIVSELYYPEETSTGYFITKIAEGLAADYDVRAVCGQPSYSERGIRAPHRERHAGVEINRLRSTHFDKDRLLLRALNLLSFTIATIFFLLVHLRRNDQILVVTNPPTVPFVCGWLAKVRGCRSTLLVHDIYPEVLAATMMMRRGTTYKLLQILFDHSFRLFDEVVVLGRDMLEIVARKLGDRADRMVIIPNWGDIDEIRPLPAEANQFASVNELQGKTIIQFSGNLGRTHDLELFVEAARSLADVPDLKFLAVGYGGKSALVREASEQIAKNLVVLPRQPRNRLSQMLNTSTATLISFVDGMYGISVPSRMYNVMAAGRPIIAVAHPQSELALVVAEEKAGWVIAREEAGESLPQLIRWLTTTEGRREAEIRGQAARKAVEKHYTLAAVIKQFRCILRRNAAPQHPTSNHQELQ